MRVLLIGPNPPPHGGVSVHVSGVHQWLNRSGVTCRILDTGAAPLGLRFGLTVLRYAFDGWTLHLHTNGHNLKSWLLALACGLAGKCSGGAILTLHSGLLPGYIQAAPFWRRTLTLLTFSLYKQVVCVSLEIGKTLLSLGLDSRRMEILPAFLSTEGPQPALDPELLAWVGRHRPLFSTVLFFRPEYGFDLLVSALARLRRLYPSLGCLVMGSGEQRPEAENRIREAGLEENILLLGDMDHPRCLALLSASDVFLRPTLRDGDSISVREALCLGVPVVASRVGARPAGAILFRPGDLEDMLAKIRLAMAAGSRGNSQSAGCMDRLIEIYRQVDGSEGNLCLN